MAEVDNSPATTGTQNARPEKPDEAKYKADLAKAEKEHEAAQARFVRSHIDPVIDLDTDST